VDDPTPGASAERRLAWVTAPGDDSYRLALRELAGVVREINGLVLETAADEPTLREFVERANELRALLESAPRGIARTYYGQLPEAEHERAFFETSPVIGVANPIAPPLRMWLEGDRVYATATFGRQYEGPPGHVHGGWVAAALDDVLGATQSAAERPGMTANLTVRYLRPTPLHRELRFEGRLVSIEGRKISAVATVHAGNVLCAEAEALFISIDFAAMYGREGRGSPGGER
jgi:acyl-coenzyme A thioesterase PaaI-like protein